ncbi:MAG: PEP-CTERM sorting domain-containing protein [Verrucomicrobia bacterium]|nr:PEP-CTERM sorting domain-containing protein [Verrucomicrobiota bacterium]
MKKSALLLTLALAGLLAKSASAQVFVGSDDFNSGLVTANWDYSYRLYGATQGDLSFTNNRLDFTKSSGQGNQFRLWNSDGTGAPNVTPASYGTSWSMTLSTTNLLTGFGVGEYTTIGLQVFNDASSYAAVMLSAGSDGLFARTEGTGISSVNTPLTGNTDVYLRLSWDAGAKTLGAAYSLDNGNYTTLALFLPVTQWDNSNPSLAVSNGFNFGVFGNSNMAAAISVGSVYADNFSVSAVPEPSTYAALAGLGALGLAYWRRRAASRA